MTILKVSQRFAKANQEKRRLRRLYYNSHYTKYSAAFGRNCLPELGREGRTCGQVHGPTYRKNQNGRGHTN